jgi:hypothetical protein
MEIADLLRLWIKEITSYIRTRLPARIYFPLALFLYTAGVAAGRRLDGPSFVLGPVLAYGLVFQFRLWDDLNCREEDRLKHPERVLPKAKSLVPFRALLAVAFALNCALILIAPYRKLFAFLLLNGAFFVWYRWGQSLSHSQTANFHILLAKYPIFIYLLSDQIKIIPLFLSGLVVYLCFCVYEVLHDPKLWAGARTVLAIEMLALTVVHCLMVTELMDYAGILVTAQIILAGAGGLGLMVSYGRHRLTILPNNWNYAVFVVGFAQLLYLSFLGR